MRSRCHSEPAAAAEQRDALTHAHQPDVLAVQLDVRRSSDRRRDPSRTSTRTLPSTRLSDTRTAPAGVLRTLFNAS